MFSECEVLRNVAKFCDAADVRPICMLTINMQMGLVKDTFSGSQRFKESRYRAMTTTATKVTN